MGDMLLGVPNSSFIILTPDYSSTFTKNLDRQDHRTKAGALYTYIEPNPWTQFKLKISWVNSNDRSLVNSWWETASDLRFIIDDDFPSSFDTVRITGKKEPYAKFVQPYFNVFYEGELVIETI